MSSANKNQLLFIRHNSQPVIQYILDTFVGRLLTKCIEDTQIHHLKNFSNNKIFLDEIEDNRVDSRSAEQNGSDISLDGKSPVKVYTISNKCHHGVALIIHNSEWIDDPNPREGSEMDARRFKDIAEMFKYDYKVETNLNADKMRAAVASTADRVQDHHDSFICFISSHGCSDGILGVDNRIVTATELVDIVGSENCAKLTNKPKIFIIQACRGRDAPGEVKILFDDRNKNHSCSHKEASVAIPPIADYLFAFCTTPRTSAMRSATRGSFYVKILYDMLREHSKKLSLYEILLLVHEELATNDSYKYTEDGITYRQMGQVVSTLRKKIYLKT